MTLVLNAVPGDPAANSYLTAAEALTLAESIPHGLIWRENEDARDQEALLLVGATTLLDDEFAWRGERASTTQALGWPRVGIVSRDGKAPVASDVIPPFVQRATLEIALYLFDQDATAGASYLGDVTEMTLGGVRVKSQSGGAARIPGFVRTILSGYYHRQRARSPMIIRA